MNDYQKMILRTIIRVLIKMGDNKKDEIYTQDMEDLKMALSSKDLNRERS